MSNEEALPAMKFLNVFGEIKRSSLIEGKLFILIRMPKPESDGTCTVWLEADEKTVKTIDFPAGSENFVITHLSEDDLVKLGNGKYYFDYGKAPTPGHPVFIPSDKVQVTINL
ncbi:hypothetical protein [Pseudomonas sp. GW456-12-1-14-TSB6]|jgi:hypothetical protein|uniref:hypothetical protein n=1 Tax=unclassified Pseudomonas TaxID=196821 RepID=UPI000CD13BAF|nr:hypothetical protein [Pseudomonas sp. GW456-12-1-14-TSB6]POA35927.1 hypothetical protein C1891_17315 [Pseudomonas sp. GW456-12-1-14-TSB6]